MEWRDISSNPAFELDQDTTARFGALVEAARAAVSAHEQHEAERRAIAERDALLRSTRTSICERLESTRAEHALDEIEKARSEWEGLPGPSKQEREDDRSGSSDSLHRVYLYAKRRGIAAETASGPCRCFFASQPGRSRS